MEIEPQEAALERSEDRPPVAGGGALRLEALEVYRGDYPVCAGLTLALARGSVLHLRGSNGAGKTSLMRVIAGLAPAESGVVCNAAGLGPRDPDYRAGLRYVAHRDGLKGELSARENLRMTQRLLATVNRFDLEQALERVGLVRLAGKRCAELSAGQRRRVALARLLLGTSSVWLLDEPLTSLDTLGVQLVEELLRAHLAAGGAAVLATHQPLRLNGLDILTVDLPCRRHVH